MLEDAPSYDLTVRGVGTFAVTGARTCAASPRPRSRDQARFHLRGDAAVLAELLAGEERRIGRFAARRAGAGAAARAPRSPRCAGAGLRWRTRCRAGARLEPALVYRALPFAIAPEWTRGHVFTVAQEIVELGPAPGTSRRATACASPSSSTPRGGAADATVTMSRRRSTRLLRGEPAPRATSRPSAGDRAAVGRAEGAGPRTGAARRAARQQRSGAVA